MIHAQIVEDKVLELPNIDYTHYSIMNHSLPVIIIYSITPLFAMNILGQHCLALESLATLIKAEKVEEFFQVQ
jgi:hypothetical protein